jgi:hypothetical protein
MPITMQGWTGDFDGQLPGRKSLQALISLSTDAGESFSDLLPNGSLTGPFQFLHVTSALAGARPATVSKITWLGVLLWAVDIKILPPDVDKTGAWPAGVNLVNIAATNPRRFQEPEAEDWSCSTLATVLVASPKKPSGGPSKSPVPPGRGR